MAGISCGSMVAGGLELHTDTDFHNVLVEVDIGAKDVLVAEIVVAIDRSRFCLAQVARLLSGIARDRRSPDADHEALP